MTALEIVNTALRRLQDKVITGLDVDSTAARASAQFFPIAMDEVTGESDVEWSFAKARATLVLDEVTENQTDYVYMYDRPDDAIMIIPSTEYEIEGSKIYSNTQDLSVLYIRSLVDTSGATPEVVAGVHLPIKFSLAVALRLATHIAIVVNKVEYMGPLQQEYNALLIQAKNFNAMETPGRQPSSDRWEEVV